MSEQEWRKSRQANWAPRCMCNAIADVYFVSRAPQPPNQYEVRCMSCGRIGPQAMSAEGSVSRWIRERDGVKKSGQGPRQTIKARSF